MPRNPPRIVVVGSANTDLVLRVSHLPRPGETVLGRHLDRAPGGKGANQAVAAARAGGKVAFVARVGADPEGDATLKGLRQAGIDVQRVVRDPEAASGLALIFVDSSGQNCIGVASGANARLSPFDVQRARAEIRRAAAVVLQLESPLNTVIAATRLAQEAGVPVILNPAPARSLPASLLKRISVLTPNETEAERLTGWAITDEDSAHRAARELVDQGVRTVVLTRGAKGALLASADGIHPIPGFRVRAVDTTAAGDVFNGAFAVALAEGQPLLAAVRFANAAAALSVTRHGAQPSAPHRRDIESLLNPA